MFGHSTSAVTKAERVRPSLGSDGRKKTYTLNYPVEQPRMSRLRRTVRTTDAMMLNMHPKERTRIGMRER